MNILQQAARRLERLGALDKVAKPLAGAVGRAVRPRVVRNLLSGTDLGHPLHPMLTDLPRPAARGHNQHCTGAVLAPGVSCNVDLRFRPTTMGPRAATLDVTANVAAYGSRCTRWASAPMSYGPRRHSTSVTPRWACRRPRRRSASSTKATHR